MTTSAHASRRFHGSTDEPTAPMCLERDKFSLRTLSPYLYKDIPSSKLSKPAPPKPRQKNRQPAEIIAWLRANGGRATGTEIAAGLGVPESSAITNMLKRGVSGVTVVDTKMVRYRAMNIWGLADGETVST